MSLTRLYEEIARIQRDGGAAALATVIGTAGSTPGKATMKMLVRRSGKPIGSVGGGCVEAEVFERARSVMASERAERFAVDLNEHDNPETGLVCGGRIEIFIEPIVMPNVVVFGAGHVARALVEVAAPAGFRCVVVDDRAEFANAERFPGAAEVHAAAWRDGAARAGIDTDAFVLVMTRGHHDDLAVLRELAGLAAPPRFLGMIGSKSKLLTLRRHLLAEGIAEAFLDSIRTPVGLAIGARSAEEIAISIAAELIQVRRGAAAAPP